MNFRKFLALHFSIIFQFFQKAVEELLSLIYQPQLTGIPLLILGNKSDLPGAFDEMQLIERL